MASVEVKIEGFNELEQMIANFQTRFTASSLTKRVMLIAEQAGVMLREEVIAQLMDAIYSSPAPEVLFSGSGLMDHGGFDTPDRTGDLADAHQLSNEGLIQTVSVDMDRPVSDNAHSGRETVGDYALPVHEGYAQYVFGNDTQTFHPGRPWMERAWIEGQAPIYGFIEEAFILAVTEMWTEAFA